MISQLQEPFCLLKGQGHNLSVNVNLFFYFRISDFGLKCLYNDINLFHNIFISLIPSYFYSHTCIFCDTTLISVSDVIVCGMHVLCNFNFVLVIIIVVIQNSASVGFSQLIQGYKQTFTVIASCCIYCSQYQEFQTCFIYLPLTSAIPWCFNCKSLFVLKD